MADTSWVPTLLQALGIGGGVGGGAVLFALLDRYFGRRDKAQDRRTEEQKRLDELSEAARKHLLEDLARERADKQLLRAELKQSNDECDRAHEVATKWRRAGRRLDDWTRAHLGHARNEIQRLASLLRLHEIEVDPPPQPVPEVPMLESFMDDGPRMLTHEGS